MYRRHWWWQTNWYWYYMESIVYLRFSGCYFAGAMVVEAKRSHMEIIEASSLLSSIYTTCTQQHHIACSTCNQAKRQNCRFLHRFLSHTLVVSRPLVLCMVIIYLKNILSSVCILLPILSIHLQWFICFFSSLLVFVFTNWAFMKGRKIKNDRTPMEQAILLHGRCTCNFFAGNGWR